MKSSSRRDSLPGRHRSICSRENELEANERWCRHSNLVYWPQDCLEGKVCEGDRIVVNNKSKRRDRRRRRISDARDDCRRRVPLLTNAVLIVDLVISNGEDMKLLQGIHLFNHFDSIVVQRQIGQFSQRVQTFNGCDIIEGEI